MIIGNKSNGIYCEGINNLTNIESDSEKIDESHILVDEKRE